MRAGSGHTASAPRAPRLRGLGVASLLTLALAAPASAQRRPLDRPNHFVVQGAPLTLGFSYARSVTRAWQLGLVVTGGKHLGVTISTEGSDDLDVWVSAYLEVAVRPVPAVALVARPIGVVGLTGGDFGAAYPSAGVGLEYHIARFRLGSDVQVVRIAGPNGTGEYWVRWLPGRLSLRL